MTTVSAWVFSGWPQITVTIPAHFTKEGMRTSFSFPPPLPVAYAATTTIILDANGDGTCGSGCWTVPSDWNNGANRIEVVGGGGGGRNGGNNGSGAGGGGAYASGENFTLSGNVGFNVAAQVAEDTGGENTWICNNTTSCATLTDVNVIIGAQGGASTGAAQSGNAGGSSSANVNTGSNPIEYDGGAGGAGDTTGDVGGGGGGAAGPKGPGGAGESTDGTTGIDGGGGGGGGGDGAGNAAEDGGVDSDGFGGDGPSGTGGGAGGNAPRTP